LRSANLISQVGGAAAVWHLQFHGIGKEWLDRVKQISGRMPISIGFLFSK